MPQKKVSATIQVTAVIDGQNGAEGNGIQSVARTYAVSSQATTASDTTPPSDITTWAAASPATTVEKPYLWTKEVVTYTKAASTTKYYMIGARGQNGIDAQDFEWAYIRTKTNTAPVIATDSSYTDSKGKAYTADDHLPHVTGNSNIESNNSGVSGKTYECTDDPKGVNDDWPYEWEIKREKGAADANGHRAWQPYSGTMTLHNNLAASLLTIDIDNDSDQFGVDADGKVLAQQARSTVVSMAYGTALQQFTAAPTASLRYDDGTTVPTSVATAAVSDVSPSDAAKTQYRVTVTVKATGTAAAVFGTSGKNGLYVDISGTCAKGGPKIIRFSLTKVMGGASGESPVIWQLNPSQKSFVFGRDASNNLTPPRVASNIYVTRTVGNTTTEHTGTSGLTNPPTFSWGFDSSSTAQASGQAIGTAISISNTQAASHSSVWIKLSTGDRETLPILKDGDVGPKGDDGYGLTLTPAQLIFEEKLGSDGQTVSIGYINNTVVAVVQKGKTPLTPTITKVETSSSYSGCDLTKITISGGTITMTSGSITLASGASAGHFTVNIKADNGAYDQNVRINFYVNRLGTFTRTINGAIETAKGEMRTYTDDKDSAVRHDYAVAIQTSAQGLTQKFTEQVSRAGADGRNLFGFSNDIVFDHATPFIQGYGLVGRPWLNTSDKTARIYNLGMYGRLGYYTVSCQVRTSASAGYVRLQMNWHTATSGTQAASGGLKGVVNATPGTWQDLTATFLFDKAAEEHIGTTLQEGEEGSYVREDINGYIDIGQIAGAKDETKTSVSDNLIYVRHLKIEYRDSASDFCEADEDIAYIGQGNLATATPYDFAASGPAGNRQHQDTDTFEGVTVKDVYVLSYDNSASKYTNTWSQWLYYSLALRQLKAGQIYTLSFWARSTVEGLKMMSTLRLSTVNTTPYNNKGSMVSPEADAIYTGSNGSIIESVRSRGDTKVLLTTDWRQYFVRYYVDTDCYLYELVAATIYADDNLGKNCDVYIGDVQLQEGYVMSPSGFSSLIEQNARRISLVQQSGTRRAGIDIQNGTVKLIGGRVTFCDSQGGNTDKIWIDPTTGALNAVDGTFSGTLRATLFEYKIQMNGTSGNDTILATTDEFVLGETTGIYSVNLPCARTVQGKKITIIKAFSSTTLKLFAKALDGTTNCPIAFYGNWEQISNPDEGYPLSRRTVLWADPDLCALDQTTLATGFGWRLIEQDKYS